jgi:ABC-type proline/glycine betaine transport system ATPase subunit
VVIVTHHPEEAWDLATRTVVLAHGQLGLDAPRQGTADDFARLLGERVHE